jgi:predicted DNA-binding protein (UPF0251 family)
MARPCKCRWIGKHPRDVIFKPLGFPTRSRGVVELALDELEALKQAHLLGLTQEQGAELMGVSRATFGRILESAHFKIADALNNLRTLAIGGGPVVMSKRRFECQECSHTWEEKFGTGRPEACPSCGSNDFYRVDSGPRHSGLCSGARSGKGSEGGRRARAGLGGARIQTNDKERK